MPLWRADIQGHRSLVPGNDLPPQTLPVLAPAMRTRRVTAGMLHLDHIGAVVTEQHRSDRSGVHRAEIQDAQTGQRTVPRERLWCRVPSDPVFIPNRYTRRAPRSVGLDCAASMQVRPVKPASIVPATNAMGPPVHPLILLGQRRRPARLRSHRQGFDRRGKGNGWFGGELDMITTFTARSTHAWNCPGHVLLA
jgi:hypothetical protein